ncbi:MAG: hypothetical protein PUF72_04440 [Clostridiales bacterium]|nr:hypothetical protein [Clostridiales bacterium]
MRDLTKKVVVLNNFTSPYIAEALIVLKDYDPRLEGKILEEAERVVSEYIEKNHARAKREELRAGTRPYAKSAGSVRKRSKLRVICMIVIAAAALVAVGIYNSLMA